MGGLCPPIIPPYPSGIERKDGGEGINRSGKNVHLIVQRFCDRMSFLSPTSAKDTTWTLGFLHPPTDSREGRIVAPKTSIQDKHKKPNQLNLTKPN